ncbi:MAG: HAD family hydrolase [Candidatus Binatia bacterium]
MVKAVFFDFDGTLADDSDSITLALTEACRAVCERWPQLDATDLAAAYRQFSNQAWSDYDRYLRHLDSPEAMLASVWRHALTRQGIDDPQIEKTAADTYWQHRLQQCQLYSDTLSVLHDLASRFPLCLLTNGAPAMQRAKVTATQITALFQHIFVGGEFSQGKPAPQIFEAALAAVQCKPNEAIHIGDSLMHDIAGARKLGIHSVWLNRKNSRLQDLTSEDSATPDFTITTLTELAECLAKISSGA